MKVIFEEGRYLVIRFDIGEEILNSLKDFCATQKIFAASFSGIGASSNAVLGFYNLSEKTYEFFDYNEHMEITGLNGNISVLDNDIVVHAHGNFAGPDRKVYGGHIKQVTVGLTAEITLVKFIGKIERSFDETTHLNLLK